MRACSIERVCGAVNESYHAQPGRLSLDIDEAERAERALRHNDAALVVDVGSRR